MKNAGRRWDYQRAKALPSVLRFKRLGSTSTLFRAFGACVLDAAAGAMFTPRITGSQSANARNQQISEPCNLQIKRKMSFLKIKQTKEGNFQQSWSVTKHQIALEELPDTTCTSERASTSRCYNSLPPDLPLSISGKKKRKSFLHFRFNLPAHSTAPH